MSTMGALQRALKQGSAGLQGSHTDHGQLHLEAGRPRARLCAPSCGPRLCSMTGIQHLLQGACEVLNIRGFATDQYAA